MDTLWTADHPLTRGEIVEMTPDRTWKERSFYILINSMIRKGIVLENPPGTDGMNSVYTFYPAISLQEYCILQLRSIPDYSAKSLPGIIAGLLEGNESPELLDAMEEVLRQKRLSMEGQSAS